MQTLAVERAVLEALGVAEEAEAVLEAIPEAAAQVATVDTV